MTVTELVERLQEIAETTPYAEVHVSEEFGDPFHLAGPSIEVHGLHQSTATYGVLTENPQTVDTVVLTP